MISIVIPIYNEEEILAGHSSWFRNLSQYAEFILVDGGSTDRSIEIASTYGKVLISPKGRAIQMNYGAGYARFHTLFFLHADSVVQVETLSSIEKQINKSNLVGGCLTQRINKKGIIYRIIEAQGNLRARLSKVFYGDQGIFVKKDIFFKIGGFPEVPIMEDVLFSRKLRNAGKTVILSDKIAVSPRRWQKRGIIKTTLIYNLISLLFRFGYPLERIKLLYDDLR